VRDLNTVQKIAEALEETEPGPLRTIERVIKVLGEERAEAILEQTQQIESTLPLWGGECSNEPKRLLVWDSQLFFSWFTITSTWSTVPYGYLWLNHNPPVEKVRSRSARSKP
jgi:hypothetical protein